MALTDILTFEGDSSAIMEMNRGNTGVVSDISDSLFPVISFVTTLPIVSNVRSGITYGDQGTEFTGTLNPSGGGGGSYTFVT